MLMTTPFLRPLRGTMPLPMMLTAPSRVTSPTSATTLLVPTSSATRTASISTAPLPSHRRSPSATVGHLGDHRACRSCAHCPRCGPIVADAAYCASSAVVPTSGWAAASDPRSSALATAVRSGFVPRVGASGAAPARVRPRHVVNVPQRSSATASVTRHDLRSRAASSDFQALHLVAGCGGRRERPGVVPEDRAPGPGTEHVQPSSSSIATEQRRRAVLHRCCGVMVTQRPRPPRGRAGRAPPSRGSSTAAVRRSSMPAAPARAPVPSSALGGR